MSWTVPVSLSGSCQGSHCILFMRMRQCLTQTSHQSTWRVLHSCTPDDVKCVEQKNLKIFVYYPGTILKLMSKWNNQSRANPNNDKHCLKDLLIFSSSCFLMELVMFPWLHVRNRPPTIFMKMNNYTSPSVYFIAIGCWLRAVIVLCGQYVPVYNPCSVKVVDSWYNLSHVLPCFCFIQPALAVDMLHQFPTCKIWLF